MLMPASAWIVAISAGGGAGGGSGGGGGSASAGGGGSFVGLLLLLLFLLFLFSPFVFIGLCRAGILYDFIMIFGRKAACLKTSSMHTFSSMKQLFSRTIRSSALMTS